jgi:hypothetical protein
LLKVEQFDPETERPRDGGNHPGAQASLLRRLNNVVVAAVHTVFASGKFPNRRFGLGIHRFIVSVGRKPFTRDDEEWAARAFAENERERMAAGPEAADANTNGQVLG